MLTMAVLLVPTKLFSHREFAFTLAGDVYIRYNSFHTADDFKKEVLRLNPSRFEIGPQYSARVGRQIPSCNYDLIFCHTLPYEWTWIFSHNDG